MQLKTSRYFLPAFPDSWIFLLPTPPYPGRRTCTPQSSGFMRTHLHRSTHLPKFGNHHLQGISAQLPNGSHFSSSNFQAKTVPKFLSKSTTKKPRGFSETQQKRGGVGSRLKARLGCNQIEEYQMAGDNSNHLQKHLTNEMV